MRNWDVKLQSWADGMVGLPFKWGETDCGTLVRLACIVKTGIECFPDIPTWSTKTQATKILKSVGGFDHVLSNVAQSIGKNFATTGDIVCVAGEGVTVLIGDRLIVSTKAHGVTMERMNVLPDDVTWWRVHVSR